MEAFRKGCVMLLREDRCRHQHGDLFARLRDDAEKVAIKVFADEPNATRGPLPDGGVPQPAPVAS